MDEPTATPAPQKAGIVEDFIDIFASPSKVFARRVNANAVIPWLIVSVILVGLFFASKGAMQSIFDGEMQRGFDAAMKANPKLTPEMLEQGKGMMGIVVNAGAIVGIPVALLCVALMVWVVGKMLKGTLTYTTALNIAVFAYVPRIVDSILKMIETLVLDVSKMTAASQIGFAVSRFLDPNTVSQPNMQLLNRLDVMILWETALLAIGLVAAGKVAKNKAVLAGVLCFVIGSIPQIWGAVMAMIKGG